MDKFGAKEWTLIVDAFIAVVLYFVGKYAPVAFEDIKFLFATLQPILALYIGAVAYDDVNKLRAGVR